MKKKSRWSESYSLLEELEPRLLLSTSTIYTDNFEYSNLSSFLSNWQVSTSGQNLAWGPNTAQAHGGSFAAFASEDESLPWSTFITTQTYANSEVNSMRHTVNLAGYQAASMTLWYDTASEPGFDGFRVDVNGSPVSGTNREGNSGGWVQMTVDLSPYCGNSSVPIQFSFYSDSAVVPSGPAGVWIDDVAITGTPAVPVQPSNISPSNGLAGVGLATTLTANAFSDPGAYTHYASQWKVWRTSDSAVVFDSGADTSHKTSITIPSGDLSYSTAYSWSVRYEDSNGQWSDYSTATGFTASPNLPPATPANVTPASGATGVSVTPTLTASAFSPPDGDTQAAAEWVIQRTRDNAVIWDSGTDASDTSSVVPPSGKLAYSTGYAWQVRYEDSGGLWSSWSTASSFTTLNLPPDTPANVTPASGATGVSLTPTLTAGDFIAPDGDTQTASEWVIKRPSDNVVVWDSGTDASDKTSATVPSGILTYNTVYLWEVRYGDHGGLWGNWSTASSFTTLNLPPNAPANVAPADGATAVSPTLTLTASPYSAIDNDIQAAAEWILQQTSDNTVVWDSGADPRDLTRVAVPSGVLAYNAGYTWRVRYEDRGGLWSSWSTASGFSTLNLAPGAPTNVAPADGATAVSLSPTLEASAYNVVDNDVQATAEWIIQRASDNSVAWDSGTDPADLTSVSVPTGNLDYETGYTWQVRYEDSGGLWSDYSTITGFTTSSNQPPNTPGPWSPADGATGVSLTPTLTGGAFSAPEGDTQAAAEWIIRRTSDNTVVWDSGEDASDLTSVTVPPEKLTYSTGYTWQVRYEDSGGLWSDWSTASGFTTVDDRPPTLSNVSGIRVGQNAIFTFNALIFSGDFSDPDAGDSLQRVQITSLPSHGSLKVNGAAVTLNQEIAVGQLGNMSYTPNSGYYGADTFGWNGSDGTLYATASASATLRVNSAPDLSFLTDLTMAQGQTQTIALPATDADGDPVTYTAAVSSAQEEAHDLQQQLSPAIDVPQYNNFRGWGEKYLTDASGTWYYILPNGDLYQWAGSGSPTGNTLIETLDGGYYQDPRRLTFANWSGWNEANEAAASVLQQKYGLTTYWSQYDNFRGWGEKYVTDAAGDWYYILSNGDLYEWAGGDRLTGNALVGTLNAAFYQDPMRLVYSWAVAAPDSGVVTQPTATELAIRPGSFVGRFLLYVTATDGVATVHKYVWVTVTPALNSVPPQTLIPSVISMLDGDSQTLTLGPATNLGGAPVTYAAAIGSAQGAARDLQQQLSLATYWSQYDNFRGWGEKYLTDTSGNWYYVLSSGDLYGWDGSGSATGNAFEGEMDAGYYQDPRRLIYASWTDWSAADEAAASALEQAHGLTAYWSQYNSFRGWGEKYLTDASGNWYYMLSTGALYQWTGSGSPTGNQLIGTENTAFYQDPMRLVCSWAVTPPASTRVTQPTATEMTITPGSFVGRFAVCVTTTDGTGITEQYIWATAAQDTLAGLSSIGMAQGQVRTVPLGPATDSHGNPITYTATICSAQAAAHGLQQQLSLATYWSQYDNARGWGEKYLTGASGIWYYILSNGDLYRWAGSGSSTGNTRIATLEGGYYQDPRRLIYANCTGWSEAGEAAASALRQSCGPMSYASGYNNARGWGEKYLTDASGHWYYILPDGAVYQWSGASSSTGNSLIGTLDQAFYQDPARLVYSWAATTADPSVVSVTGTQATITPGSFAGQLLVCVSSTAWSDKQYVWVTVS